MRFLLSLLVSVLASVSASSNQATHASVSDAFFPAHTHSMLVHPATIQPSRSAVHVSISAPTLSPSTTSHPQSVSISTVADTQRRVMGLIPLLTQSTLPITSSFNLPHASIQLSVQSADGNLAHALSTNDATHVTLKDVSYAADDVALATTLSTGKQPKDTGVVARTWVDSAPMTAFSSAASSSHVATVADIVSQSFDGQSLVLSISADSQMSMASCIHPSLATTNNARWNFFCVSLDDKTFAPRQFPSTSNIAMTQTKSALTRRLTVSRTDLIKQLTSAGSNVLSALPSSISVVYGDESITIDGVTFSLSSSVDMSLLLELQYINTVISVLSESDLIQDGVPDHIAINVASLQTIRAHYGVDSPQYRVAMKIVQHCLPSLMSRLSDIYDDSVVRTVILLGNEPVTDSQLKQHMTQHVKEQLSLSHLPFLSISDSASVHSVCTTVDATLRRYGYAVYCPDSHLYSHAYKTLAIDRPDPAKFPGCNATAAGNCTVYSPYRVQKYQILLWFSIILVLITLSAIFTLCCMKFKKDTMLYSSFNPNWEDRKRR